MFGATSHMMTEVYVVVISRVMTEVYDATGRMMTEVGGGGSHTMKVCGAAEVF